MLIFVKFRVGVFFFVLFDGFIMKGMKRNDSEIFLFHFSKHICLIHSTCGQNGLDCDVSWRVTCTMHSHSEHVFLNYYGNAKGVTIWKCKLTGTKMVDIYVDC